MKAIVMDTSNSYLAISIYEDDVELEHKQIQALKKQSELAIPYLEEMLQHQHLDMKDIDEMIVSIGPGSYTGVRIALTIAKTLAAILPIKIKAISSLKMLAGMNRAISIIDARGKKYYVGMYDQGHALMEECLMNEQELENFKQEHQNEKTVMYHDALPICQHLYDLAKLVDYVEDSDALVPKYIKEVEAKKQCL